MQRKKGKMESKEIWGYTLKMHTLLVLIADIDEKKLKRRVYTLHTITQIRARDKHKSDQSKIVVRQKTDGPMHPQR